MRRKLIADEVVGGMYAGYATHVLCEATYVRPLPPGWGFDEGASFLCTALTAWYGLVKLGALSENDTVLVHSAAGGVGLASLEIVAAHGAHAIATIGSPAKAQMLRDRMNLEPQAILVRPSTAQEFSQQLDICLEAMNPQRAGIDIVMDSIQGPYFQPAYDKLARGGRIVVFGAASMTPTGDRPNWIKLAWHWLRRPMVRPRPSGSVGGLFNACSVCMARLFLAHMCSLVRALRFVCAGLDAARGQQCIMQHLVSMFHQAYLLADGDDSVCVSAIGRKRRRMAANSTVFLTTTALFA